MQEMQIIDHARQAREEWRPGVLTRMLCSAVTGARQLCLFEQWCEPGRGAPTHLHAVEELLTVVAGAAPIFEAAFDDAREVSRRWLPVSGARADAPVGEPPVPGR